MNRINKIKRFLDFSKNEYLKFFSIKELWKLAENTKENTFKRCVVVGLAYYDWHDSGLDVNCNEDIKLIREPDNRFDKWAIKVCFKQYKIGYVREEENQFVLPGSYKIIWVKENSLILERID